MVDVGLRGGRVRSVEKLYRTGRNERIDPGGNLKGDVEDLRMI